MRLPFLLVRIQEMQNAIKHVRYKTRVGHRVVSSSSRHASLEMPLSLLNIGTLTAFKMVVFALGSCVCRLARAGLLIRVRMFGSKS